MKIRSTLLVFMLALWACESPQDPAEDALPHQVCVTEPRYIFAETANLWLQSWQWHQGQTQEKLGPQRPVTFSSALLAKLKTATGASDGMRVYYGIADAAQITPNLIVVPTRQCQALRQPEQLVLLANAEGGSLRPYREVKQQIDLWQARTATQPDYMAVIWAYNYPWPLLRNANANIEVQFGMRTLAPQDREMFSMSGTAEGHYAWVNVWYEQSAGVRRYLRFAHPKASLASAATTNEGNPEDFTNPCPQMCDDDD